MPVADPTPERPQPTVWEIPDELWERIEPVLLRRYPVAPTGRPRADLRLVLDAIVYRMRSGVQWNRLPRSFGADSTVHGWFQRFVADGVLEEVWAALVAECEGLDAVLWEWQAADGVMGKSRFDGDKRGPNPTDRAKMGTKKHLIVEQDGGPLGVVVDGANVNDHKLLAPTIEAIVIERPDPEEVIQHLCLDKAYDNKTGDGVCEAAGYVPHIRRIGEEKLDRAGEKTRPARRWVVERTIAWLQRCRAILIPLRQEAGELRGADPARLRPALVAAAGPAQSARGSSRIVTKAPPVLGTLALYLGDLDIADLRALRALSKGNEERTGGANDWSPLHGECPLRSPNHLVPTDG